MEGGFLTTGPPGKPLHILILYIFFFLSFASTLNILNSSGVYFLYVTMVLSGYILKPHEELFKIVLFAF